MTDGFENINMTNLREVLAKIFFGEDAEAKKNLEELVSNASTRNKEDNELLDAFLPGSLLHCIVVSSACNNSLFSFSFLSIKLYIGSK